MKSYVIERDGDSWVLRAFGRQGAQGHDLGKDNKDDIELRMTREQIAEAQRLSREWIAARR